MTAKILIMPGLGNSGPAHWQTLWQEQNPSFIRVEQENWEEPERESWIATLDQYISACTEPPILVAHSLATVTIAHWSKRFARPIRAAMLVAPADVDSEQMPPVLWPFRPMPLQRLPFPSVLVASTNDPYANITRIETIARAWGSELVIVGALGHINAHSQIGDWAQGKIVLQDFCGISI